MPLGLQCLVYVWKDRMNVYIGGVASSNPDLCMVFGLYILKLCICAFCTLEDFSSCQRIHPQQESAHLQMSTCRLQVELTTMLVFPLIHTGILNRFSLDI